MQSSHIHPVRRALTRTFPRLPLALGWKSAGVLALLCSGVAWASLPHVGAAPGEDQRQWQALGIAPLASGGATGMRMAATDAVEPVDFVPKRVVPVVSVAAPAPKPAAATGPLPQ